MCLAERGMMDAANDSRCRQPGGSWCRGRWWLGARHSTPRMVHKVEAVADLGPRKAKTPARSCVVPRRRQGWPGDH